jgi:hypothetical protein
VEKQQVFTRLIIDSFDPMIRSLLTFHPRSGTTTSFVSQHKEIDPLTWFFTIKKTGGINTIQFPNVSAM